LVVSDRARGALADPMGPDVAESVAPHMVHPNNFFVVIKVVYAGKNNCYEIAYDSIPRISLMGAHEIALFGPE
jgi:hypothetical protein